MKLKSQIEAILFLSDKPVKAAAMARIVSQDVQIVRQALLELIHDYEERDGGLEITDDDGYIIQVRDAYASIVDEFAPMEMPVSLIRTLSAIAIKQPVAQSEIIKIRGAGAYDHIKELILRDLILKKEEGGRSPALSTTKKFQEYFRLTQDAKILRTQLSTEVRAAKDAAEALKNGEATAEDNELDFAPGKVGEQIGRSEPVATPSEPQPAFAGAAEIVTADAVTTEAVKDADTAADTTELDIGLTHLKSKINLENLFATSPDASFVFRPPSNEQHNAAVAAKDGGQQDQEARQSSED